MTRLTTDEIMARETTTMGRACTLIDTAELPFDVRVVVYSVEPISHPTEPERVMQQFRVATYAGDRQISSGITHSEWSDA